MRTTAPAAALLILWLNAGVQHRVLAVVSDHLVDASSPESVVQALYVLCNLATGSAALKDAIAASPALTQVLRLLVCFSQIFLFLLRC